MLPSTNPCALESLGILYNFADLINETISNQDVVIVICLLLNDQIVR